MTTENFNLMIGTTEQKNPMFKENYRHVRFGKEIRSEALKLYHAPKVNWKEGLTREIIEDFIVNYLFGKQMIQNGLLYLVVWGHDGKLAVRRA